jgi:hypothetical protein
VDAKPLRHLMGREPLGDHLLQGILGEGGVHV